MSKILFLSCIFPPTDKWLKIVNKLCCNFIWDSTREVTKRNLLYKRKELGGLGAIDIAIKTKISVCKIIANGINRQADWIGNITNWKQKKSRARTSVPYYKFLYGDFINKYKNLDIDWINDSNKKINGLITDEEYGSKVEFRNLVGK